jgi:hypothetical protein
VRETRSGNPAPAAGNTPPRSPRPPEVIQIEHPANGSFDIVVQSSGGDGLPDVGVVLRGSPVYTVYLPVGDHKEWLLEYCVAAGQSSRSGTNQVSIGGGAPITPPFPVSTTVPRSILGQTIANHLVFRGLLSANGSLQNMTAPTAESPLASQILEMLGQWRFRPALRNDTAIDVEVLLVIPARS